MTLSSVIVGHSGSRCVEYVCARVPTSLQDSNGPGRMCGDRRGEAVIQVLEKWRMESSCVTVTIC